MKHFGFFTGCLLAFMLGTMVPLRESHAQGNPAKRTFYQISFMKSKAGQDALKMERELWRPIQAGRVSSGHLISWTVMQPLFAGPHPYDYMTMEIAENLDDFTKLDYPQLMKKSWVESRFEANVSQTMNARDMIGNEMWEVVESVAKPAQ